MRRILFGCALALMGVIGLEIDALTSLARPEPLAAPATPALLPLNTEAATIWRPEIAKLAAAILDRPLFSPGRRPDATPQASERLPRLTGLLLSPKLQRALLQTSDAEGVRADTISVGDAVAGWRLAALDRQSVLLRRGKQSVRLRLRPAGARESPPIPIEQIVIMPTKRTNPQLAW